MSSKLPKAFNRLPLQKTIEVLQSSTAAVKLSPRVRGLYMKFVAKNSPAGPRQFLREYAPALSYANPSIPFHVHRIRDPRAKHKDPNNPDKEAVSAGLWDGPGGSKEMPVAEMTVDFHDGPKQTLPLAHLDGKTILQQLISVAGEKKHAGLLA
ncbi:hypothetical protein L204_105407 [Cryptococcus depauperatus]|nr:hypothetical protein L204_02822 [Cryptococcus depauperatus CBS 7855]